MGRGKDTAGAFAIMMVMMISSRGRTSTRNSIAQHYARGGRQRLVAEERAHQKGQYADVKQRNFSTQKR